MVVMETNDVRCFTNMQQKISKVFQECLPLLPRDRFSTYQTKNFTCYAEILPTTPKAPFFNRDFPLSRKSERKRYCERKSVRINSFNMSLVLIKGIFLWKDNHQRGHFSTVMRLNLKKALLSKGQISDTTYDSALC